MITTISNIQQKVTYDDDVDQDRKGTTGVGTNGVIASFVFFDRGAFWVLPLT